MTENTGACHGGTCESCGMPIESGPYCRYCRDADGNLQVLTERLTRMSQWLRREESGLSDEQAQAKALDSRSSMPAWRDHPELLKRRGGKES